MKNILLKGFIAILVIGFSVGSAGCKTTTVRTTKTTTSGNLPPGQAKKLNGDKSAKKYAPGQQKKKNKKKH